VFGEVVEGLDVVKKIACFADSRQDRSSQPVGSQDSRFERRA